MKPSRWVLRWGMVFDVLSQDRSIYSDHAWPIANYCSYPYKVVTAKHMFALLLKPRRACLYCFHFKTGKMPLIPTMNKEVKLVCSFLVIKVWPKPGNICQDRNSKSQGYCRHNFSPVEHKRGPILSSPMAAAHLEVMFMSGEEQHYKTETALRVYH